MNTTRTIQVFLASSEELKADRNTFGNLIRRLDNIYEKRDIRIKLFEWEDCDAAYNNHRKQDEYNDEVRASDMFLALFYKKVGKFTIEEFNVATEEFQRTGIKPKSYVYCRDLPEEERETKELKEFKRRLFEEMGYYWMRYNNEDSLQLHFVMQLQLVENSLLDNLKVENGEVKLDGTIIAHMEYLRFAANNPDYQSMNHRLQELPQKIEEARLRVENHPNGHSFKDDLQELLNEKNKLQKEFDQHQQLLFDTAKRIAILQSETITDRMRRAIDAFERGNVREANNILDEAEKDGDSRFAEFEKKEELREKEICNIHSDIENLFMQTATAMADVEVPIQTRINKTIKLYKKADYRASCTAYDKEKYSYLLFHYALFLYKYGLYYDAKQIYLRQIPLSVELYGKEHENIAISYNNIGEVYKEQGDYEKALEYHQKALLIREEVLGAEHPETAISYNNIGSVYCKQGKFDKALEYHLMALAIRKKIYGTEHPNTATSYNNIGLVYREQGFYGKALEHFLTALQIVEKHPVTQDLHKASSYNNIGEVYYKQGNYNEALKYFQKAMEIDEKVLGEEQHATAFSYNNIGSVYHKQGNYAKALEFFRKALAIDEKILGEEHLDTAIDYNNIGSMYYLQGDYQKALECLGRAYSIRMRVLGPNHPNTMTIMENIRIVMTYLQPKIQCGQTVNPTERNKE